MQLNISILLLGLLCGCASPPPERIVEMTVRVDPRLLAHGGYSAKFMSEHGHQWLIHYFDSQGHIMTSSRWSE